ncbi:MAG TPA: hypothetical protein VL371_24215 [Gemmataceae bacterium]|nr:hypothetical protein [Gemmataceae bacterium]
MGAFTLFTVTVDTEEEWDWGAGYPTENLSLRNIAELPRLHEACSRHGAAVTYFANYAVLSNPAARRTLLDLHRQPGVEIGMHIHPWNTPPLTRRGQVPPRETFLHNLPPDQVRAKLEAVYGLFEQHGLRPTSFRGGRFSTSEVVQDFLRDKGFVADASVLPFSTWEDDGAPDYRDRRPEPTRRPPRRPGEPGFWELPSTMGYSRRPFGLWHRLFEAVANTPLRHLRLIGLAERLGLVRKAWLSFESPLGRPMLPFLRLLRKQRLPCVDFMLHSSSLLPGGSGFTRTSADRDRLFASIDEVLGTVRTWSDFQPATVTEVANHLEKQHACSRN